MRMFLARCAERIWRSKGLISTLLLPLSWLTAVFVRNKTTRYAAASARLWQSPVPIVVVGNIYVGGTGKTPVVMALVEAMRKRGWNPGVVSRGYGIRLDREARVARGRPDPSLVGDEAALIGLATQAPVAVHPQRVKAAQALLQAWPDVNLLIADDGLQHLRLQRDAEIIVQDHRGIGNGRLLPAGPLREPPERLQTIDFIITHLSDRQQIGRGPHAPTHTARTTTRPDLTQAKPQQLDMRLAVSRVVHLATGQTCPWPQWLEKHRDVPMAAIAGIGDPQRFFTMLQDYGLCLTQTRALPDHAAYDEGWFNGLDAPVVVMTAKDAIKCRTHADTRLYAIEVSAEFSCEQWLDHLHQILKHAAGNSMHDSGHDKTLN